MFLIGEEEKNEIIDEIKMTEANNFENLKKNSQKLDDIISKTPQQLPLVFLIRKELSLFQANIDIDYQNKSNLGNRQLATEQNIIAIKALSNKIYNIFDNMYKVNFYNQICDLINIIQNDPIYEIIINSRDLLKLTEKKDQNNYRLKLNEKGAKNTPKYWSLRIREALIASFNFNDNSKLKKIIEYFEANCQLFVFISKLKRVCNEFDEAYNSVFPKEEQTNTKNKLPKEKRLFLDMYIRRFVYYEPISQSNYTQFIEAIDFDKFTNAAQRNSQ